MPEQQAPQPVQSQQPARQQQPAIDLVRLAEKVYRLMLEDLRLERVRAGRGEGRRS